MPFLLNHPMGWAFALLELLLRLTLGDSRYPQHPGRQQRPDGIGQDSRGWECIIRLYEDLHGCVRIRGHDG